MSLELDGVNGIIKNTTSDGDVTIKGNDGGSEISLLTFDVSAEGVATFNSKVGIGESSAGSLLHVKASDTGIAPHSSAQITLEREGTNFLQFLTAETGTSGILFGDGSDIDVAKIVYDHNVPAMQFFVETSEVARFDSSGNFLVGTSATTAGNEGLVYFNGSSLRVTRDGDEPLNLDRRSSDGEIIALSKDGTVVGRISSTSTGIALGTPKNNGSGLHLISDAILPSTSTGGTADGSKDLGSSGSRFKDIHLSGAVNAGSLTVDDITIDNSRISDDGDLLVDVGADITLDAGGGDIILSDDTTIVGTISMNNNSGDLYIRSRVQDKDMLFRGNDGGSEITALTLDMSLGGSATFNHDIQMPDNGLLRMGAGGDLILTSDGTNGSIFANEGNLTLDTAGVINLDADNGGNINLKDDGTLFGTFQNEASDLRIISIIQDKDIIFRGNDGGAYINALTLDMSDGGKAIFNNDIALGDTQKLVIGDSEDLQIYHASGWNIIKGTTGNVSFQNQFRSTPSTGEGFVYITETSSVTIGVQATTSTNAMSFRNGNGEIGVINTNGSTTSFLNLSDYRKKENVDYLFDATTRLKQLKPCRFNWIADNTNTLQDGFLAHEVSAICPEAVVGEKDAVYTKDDVEKEPYLVEGEAKNQMLDASKLIPLLVKTVQELEARITTLENN